MIILLIVCEKENIFLTQVYTKSIFLLSIYTSIFLIKIKILVSKENVWKGYILFTNILDNLLNN